MKSSMLSNIIRTQLVRGALALSLLTLPIFGCSTMTTEEVNGQFTTTTFGNDILTSFENVFEDWRFEQLLSKFSNETNEKNWNDAIEYTNKLDKIRDQNIGDYLSEFKEIM